MIEYRVLARADVPRIVDIDRAEYISQLYAVEDGELKAEACDLDVKGWSPGEAEQHVPWLERELDEGGTMFGALDGERLVGVAVLGGRFRGRAGDQLQLVFMHVSNGYRRQGIGSRLMADAARLARDRGARCLYISATPSQSAVGFYLSHGSRLAPEVDEELFALEPEDIHLLREL